MGGTRYFTPSIGLSHASVEADTYTETGAGNLNLTVDQADTSVTLGTLGVRLHGVVGDMIPELRASMQYDFASDEAEATATFAGGGAAFTTTGAEVENFGYNLGVGVGWDSDGTSFSLSYDAGLKDSYLSHTGVAEVKVSF